MLLRRCFHLQYLILMVGFYTGAPHAQEAAKTEPGQQVAAESSKDDEITHDPYSIVLGSFIFKADIEFSLGYDSNIFAERDYEVDDTILRIAPSLSFTSNWDRHMFNASLGGEIGRYNQHPSEDYEDAWINLDGRYDVSETANIFGGVSRTQDHEERGTPAVIGTIPTTFDSDQAHIGVAKRVGDFKFRLGGTYEKLDFDDAGPITNDDRDRELNGLGLRINYLYALDHEFFIQAIRDIRDYKLDVDDAGYQRDSDGYSFAFGLKTRHSNQLSSEAYLGRLYQSYEDSRFDEVSTADFHANVSYLSSPRSRVRIILDRSLEETTLPDASSYLQSMLTVQALRQVNARDSVVAAIGIGRADYQGVQLEEDIYDASIDWRHRLSPEVSLSLNYRLLINDSNQVVAVNNAANPQYEYDYVRQEVMLSLNTTLFPVEDPDFARTPSLEALLPAQNDWHGIYLGAQLGHAGMHADTYGIRGTSGTDYAEFGDIGNSAGLFAGVGFDKERWYFGIEAQANRDNQNTAHTKAKTISRTYNIESKQNASLSLRGGYILESGVLLYASIGRARAEFDTQFMINDEPQNAVNASFNVDGARYGLGVDVPVSDSLFLRMAYHFTNYDYYVVDAVTTAEQFNPSDNVFNLGLGFLFDGNGSLARKNPTLNISGFYAGVQLGHGSLNSQLAGIHNDGGSTPGTFDFYGDFGNNTGFTSGLFAGVGKTWDSTYVGLEVETEGSSAEWEHIREPTGRDFGLQKKSAVGLGFRVGYKMQSGTLLYVSGSRTRARFLTTYLKGGNATNDLDRDDKVYGYRVGVGADIPTSRSVFIRTSYTYTDYEAYRFVTEHNNFDDMTFDNSESLFRLGLGVRF